MRIHVAKAHGLCFGVRDALALASQVERPEETTIYGELVHNEVVQAQLESRGFPMMSEKDRRIPATPAVLVTAHGISGADRGRLAAAGLRIVDTTCPLVRHAHATALALDAEDRLVVVVGRADHVEVRGLTGDLRRFVVVESASEAAPFGADRLGVMSQTTTPQARFEEVVRAIRERNPDADMKVVSTVCRPTHERQDALEDLLERVEALVVVGGSRSRNSHELARAAEARGLRAVLVQGPHDLEPSWFEGIASVGLTAGTSTLPETVDAVLARLREIGAERPERALR